ncbi:MAG TPA: hypothetical protein VFQ22_12905 [Longimicrobiales bacterium]|nr:hypothetical protein [Longimicrobiales bacterium]
MPKVTFDALPAHGRAWVFPASRTLEEREAEGLLEAVDAFLDSWAAHGVPLVSARELVERRFLLVGVDVDAEAPSGCSIDALVNRLRAYGAEIGASLIDHAGVLYRAGGEIRQVARPEFRALAEAGEVGPDTRVFDTTLTTVGQIREGALERPASETWHGRVFFRAAAGSG